MADSWWSWVVDHAMEHPSGDRIIAATRGDRAHPTDGNVPRLPDLKPEFRALVEAEMSQLIEAVKPFLASPIEEQLLASIVVWGVVLEPLMFLPPTRYGAVCMLAGWHLSPQRQTGRYRLDFALEHLRSGRRIAVECDGHDWHEKTREQAEHDRKRDRWLQGDGWTVLRFTGREIHRAAPDCALEVLGHMQRMGGD